MVEVEFNYQQIKISIQSNLNDIFKEIIQKYVNKANLDINNIYFISNGKIINKEDKLENLMSESDKRNKKIIILVYSINNNINIENTNIRISKDVICPKCKEICKYKIKDYKIKLYDCTKGHITENINLNEYENNQIIDISQIKCNICKDKNKSNTFNNEFYICYECKINLCPLCKSIHDKTHSIINYDNKNYICNKHNETLVQYCNNCNIDMCLSCSNEHKKHKIILYQDKLIDTKDLRKKMIEFENVINKLKLNLEGIINQLKKTIENMNTLYNINNNILNNYEKNKNRNYKLLLNLNYMDKYIENEINKIKNEYDYGYNLNKLLNIEDTKIRMISNQNFSSNINQNMKIHNQDNKKTTNININNKINENLSNSNNIIGQDNNHNNLSQFQNINNNNQFKENKNKQEFQILQTPSSNQQNNQKKKNKRKKMEY